MAQNPEDSMNKKNTPPGVTASDYAKNLIYNNLTSQQQQQRMAQAAIQQCSALSMMRDHQSRTRSDDILAAAVQHHLAASLASSQPSIPPMYTSLGNLSHLVVGNDLPSGSSLASLSRAYPNSHGSIPFMHDLQQGNSSSAPRAYLQRESGGAQPNLLLDSVLDASTRIAATTNSPTATKHIPCQARGMAADHNSMTAYFEIPSDALHGQHLYCSHPACRGAGVKFRYCCICKKPVTKQNFRSRHLHADTKTIVVQHEESAAKKSGAVAPSGRQQAKKRTSDEADLDKGPQKDKVIQRTNHFSGGLASLLTHRGPNHVSTSPRLQQRRTERSASSGEELQEYPPAPSISSASRPRATTPICPGAILMAEANSHTRNPRTESMYLSTGSTSNEDAVTATKKISEEDSTQRNDPSQRGSADGRHHDKLALTTRPPPPPVAISSGGGGYAVEGRPSSPSLKGGASQTSRWVSLLFERPQSLADGIGAWLSKVLAVSDKSQTWQVEAEGRAGEDIVLSPTGDCSMEQLSRWKSLLDDRPPTSEEMGERATSWLSSVLEVSCMDYEPTAVSSIISANREETPPAGGVRGAAGVLDEEMKARTTE